MPKRAHGVFWHKGISGRKDEYVKDEKALEFIHFQDFPTVTI